MRGSRMPSDTHQWLTVWLGRRLLNEGFKLVGADAGAFAPYLGDQIPSSITLPGVRPDVIGIHTKYRSLAVGEAKTYHDIPCEHTMIQLAAMLAMRDNRGRRARVYLAFPRSALQVAA